MKKYFFLFSCIALVLACKTQITPETVSIDKEKLLYNLKVISHDSMQGRFFGTEGNYKTQQYVADQFKALGIAPAFASGSIQQFPHTFKGKFRQCIYPIANPAEDYSNVPDTTVTGGNVVTMIKGKSDKAIVITAHLDHLGIKNGEIFNGADDDASGTAALLAIADHFKNKFPNHTLIFAAVDAEEIGSLGADYLLNNFPIAIENIALNINMDMIGRNDAFQLYAAGLYHNPHLRQPLDNIKSAQIELLYGHDDPNDVAKADWTFSSDHRIFHKKQIPFIYFGVEDHKDYHRPTDTYDNINTAFYVSAVELIIEAIENYDSFLMDEV